jgi:hypothetical protein
MIYEQRTYKTVPGRLPNLLARMEKDNLPLWEKHGIRPVAFFTTVDESANGLVYLLAWESLDERETKWGAFQADPEWLAKKAESVKDGQIVESTANVMLRPTAFSRLK